VKTGSVVVDGFKVNRRYSNFRVKPESDQYLNNNGDGWDRQVLLKAYRTFIGGHNFVEHVQVEELSKGRIIDAVARDIGDSIYVDILIATDRKHADLVKKIKTKKMGTLSMGCTIDFSICTKCGHVAADETEMCGHVKYQKGNTFFDETGKQHRVAELCGHSSVDPTGGVQFIEASWVETPAFTGAVLRNVLEFDEATAKKARKILATPPPEWSVDATLKAASVTDALIPITYTTPLRSHIRVDASDDDAFLAGWMDEGGGGDEEPPADTEAPPEDSEGGEAAPDAPPSEPKVPFKDVEDDVYNQIKDRIRDRFKKDLAPPGSTTPVSTNETLNKLSSGGNLRGSQRDQGSDTEGHGNAVDARQASFARKAYLAGLDAIVRMASSDAMLIDRVAAFNNQVGIVIPVEIYRAALKAFSIVGDSVMETKVGSLDSFPLWGSHGNVCACRKALGREPSMGETKTLVRLGKLLAKRRSLGAGK
jgi:hypothetical protein